jgi:hypothetical protein
MSNQFTIYFAGSLFNHKDLTGNALLVQHIEKCSAKKYRCFLPQDVEQHHTSAREIRNELILKLIECDLGLFSFDGTELDAGVVVEFMLAKFLDMPAVILRSDFRICGEKEIGSDNWNFMCSFYPRTKIVQVNAILCYQEALEASETKDEAINRYFERIADLVVDKLEAVTNEEPLSKGDQNRLKNLYKWVLTFTGGGIENMVPDESFADQISAAKIEKGLA